METDRPNWRIPSEQGFTLFPQIRIRFFQCIYLDKISRYLRPRATLVDPKILHLAISQRQKPKQRHHELPTCGHGPRRPLVVHPRQWPSHTPTKPCYQSERQICDVKGRSVGVHLPPSTRQKAYIWLPLCTTLFLNIYGW